MVLGDYVREWPMGIRLVTGKIGIWPAARHVGDQSKEKTTSDGIDGNDRQQWQCPNGSQSATTGDGKRFEHGTGICQW